MESTAEAWSAVTWRFLGLAVAPWLLQVLEKKNNLSWPWWEYGGRETCSTSVGMLEPAEVKQQHVKLCTTPMCINHPKAQQGSSAVLSLLREHHETVRNVCS